LNLFTEVRLISEQCKSTKNLGEEIYV
jgi:hypothetical protein